MDGFLLGDAQYDFLMTKRIGGVSKRCMDILRRQCGVCLQERLLIGALAHFCVRSFCPSGDTSFREPPFAAILYKRAATLIERLVLAFRYECPSCGPDHVDRLLNGAGNLRAHISSSGG